MTAAGPPRLGDYLQHIVQAIDRIDRYTSRAGFGRIRRRHEDAEHGGAQH
jgi:uncharacterized protein with HEPN domain